VVTRKDILINLTFIWLTIHQTRIRTRVAYFDKVQLVFLLLNISNYPSFLAHLQRNLIVAKSLKVVLHHFGSLLAFFHILFRKRAGVHILNQLDGCECMLIIHLDFS
jgi:hypothetical protein